MFAPAQDLLSLPAAWAKGGDQQGAFPAGFGGGNCAGFPEKSGSSHSPGKRKVIVCFKKRWPEPQTNAAMLFGPNT